jgi:hypothetical protein
VPLPPLAQRILKGLAWQDATGDARTVTVRVPISIRRRGGRKLVLAPDGAEVTAAPIARHVDNAMVKAIARAFRWRELLENGTHACLAPVGSVGARMAEARNARCVSASVGERSKGIT